MVNRRESEMPFLTIFCFPLPHETRDSIVIPLAKLSARLFAEVLSSRFLIFHEVIRGRRWSGTVPTFPGHFPGIRWPSSGAPAISLSNVRLPAHGLIPLIPFVLLILVRFLC